MSDPVFPPSYPGADQPFPVVLGYDAAGRPVVGVPAAPQVPAAGHHCAACACDQHQPARPAALWGLAPGTAVAVVVGGGLVVAVVLVALLLSVAVVASALAVSAVAVTGSVLALRSMVSPRPERRGHRR